MLTAEIVKKELENYSNKENQIILKRFFKTEKGEYGENDLFIGVKVPDQRKVAKKFYKEISFEEVLSLLYSNYHEHRLTALLMMILKYENAKNEKEKKEIVDIYLNNLNQVNNWDLVDLSAPKILGNYLYDKNRTILYDLAKTNHLWRQRVAIVSTLFFIKKNEVDDTFEIAKILLNHKHHLIHKAVGWMLREAGKSSFEKEFNFLKLYYKNMPRTMLRYAIEKFDKNLQKQFLNGSI